VKRGDKQQLVESMRDELQGVQHAVLLEYKGITVPLDTELRAKIRSSGGSYRVVKNRLFGLAVAEAPLGLLKDQMSGPTALAWSDDAPVELAKALHEFLKLAPMLKVKAVMIDGERLPAEQLTMVASLASKDQLRARLAGALASPLRKLVTVLSASQRGLASVMKQRAEKG